MIAFHYPPAAGSSGIQRTLSFSRYLPSLGWNPIIISANERAYPQTSRNQLDEIPMSVPVIRASAWDAARHFSIRNRYIGALALPDRWSTWWLAAVPVAIRAVRRYKPDAIWSTFPIATAHLIALSVHRLTRLPWIADFRDSMTEHGYPKEKFKRRIYQWIERRVVSNAKYVVFTAPSALKIYKARYPALDHSKWQCIVNGYDEVAFEKATRDSELTSRKKEPIVLLHSGLLYPSERDPTAFFEALKELRDQNPEIAEHLEIRLRASGFDSTYKPILDSLQIADIVRLEKPIDYSAALREMMEADGLLLFQASNCNHQIPAKVYEYFRAKRPILALTDPAGDTAGLLARCGLRTIARLDSASDIRIALMKFLTSLAENSYHLVSEDIVRMYSRKSQTNALAKLFSNTTRQGTSNL